MTTSLYRQIRASLALAWRRARNELGAGVLTGAKLYGEIAADDQANQVLSGIDDLTAKFRALQGKDRMDQYPVIRQQMDQLYQSGRANLGTADQTLAYDRQTRFLYQRSLREAGDLYDQGMKEWGVGVNKAGADLALVGGARAAESGDLNSLESHTKDLILWRNKDAELHFGSNLSPDMRSDIERGARADMTKAAVQSLITSDPMRAQQMLEAGRNNMPAAEYAPLAAHLKGEVANFQGQQMAFGPSAGGNPTIAPSRVTQIAQASGVDPALANATAALESGHGSNVGTRGDIYQMGPNERAAVGGGAAPAANADLQTQQGVQFLGQKRQELQTALGRDPTNAEIYLAHQQGTGGAVALLTHPNDPAGRVVGNDAAIRANGGDPEAPASQFVAMWQQRYQHAEQQYSTGQPVYPYPSGKLQQIMQSNASPEAKAVAARLTELQWTDQNHAYEQQQHQIQEASRNRENQIISDVYSPSPTVTLQQVANDPALTPESRMRMLGFVSAGPNPKVNVAASQHTAMGLLDDMRKPAGDPSRITSMDQITDAYTQGKLTREDFTFLQGQFANVRSPDGDKLANMERDFVNGMKSSITKSNPLLGNIDHEGDPKFYEFNWMVNQRVAQYRQEGKNPFDLFDPSKPDYLGTPKAMQQYTTSMTQSTQHVTDALGLTIPQAGVQPQAPGNAVPAAPTAPPTLPRQPGESMQSWVARMHLGLPGVGAPPNPGLPAANQAGVAVPIR